MAYAENTKVSVETSQAELLRLLRKHGADDVGVAQGSRGAAIVFRIGGVPVRVELPPVDRAVFEKRVREHRNRFSMNVKQRGEWVDKQVDQEERRRWRALVLITKAKLELVGTGMTTVEREFMADVVIDGKRVEELLAEPLGRFKALPAAGESGR